jgi:hypothetical protein
MLVNSVVCTHNFFPFDFACLQLNFLIVFKSNEFIAYLRFNLITSTILLISFFFPRIVRRKARLFFNFGCLIFVMECHESYELVRLVMQTLNHNLQIWFERIISFLNPKP